MIYTPFVQLKNLVGSIHAYEPDTKVVVYDLGFTGRQRRAVECWQNVVVRDLDLRGQPEHVRYLTTYAFKPLMLQAAADEFGRMLYLDSGQEIRGSLDEVSQPYVCGCARIAF